MSIQQAATHQSFDVQRIRKDFPILDQQVNGHPLTYLDNAATTQKPECVIEAIADFYRHDNANVHRGVHTLSDRSTQAFENARKTVSTFLGSPRPEQIIWTSNTTAAINMVAYSWGRSHLTKGDKVLVPWLEHHSNIVPWQLVAAEKGAQVVPIPVTDRGEIELDALDALLDERVKMIAVNHVSNALGTVNPIEQIIKRARTVGALVLLDGAQSVAHWPIDVTAIGCDFFVMSAHKLFGPTGVGVLWGREALLDAMPPFLGGGEMIERVSFPDTTFNTVPFKFEAGTPNMAGAVGLAAAINYVSALDRVAVQKHEAALLQLSWDMARDVDGLKRVGTAEHTVGVFSFLLEGSHPSDVGMILDQQGIAVRTGHHCAQPLMDRLGIPGTVRASYSIYNTQADVLRLFEGIHKAKEFFA
ncbi:MAG: cysteine desulfurase [Pseudomonadota bacterium]